MLTFARIAVRPIRSSAGRALSLNARSALDHGHVALADDTIKSTTANSNDNSTIVDAIKFRKDHEIRLTGTDCESFIPMLDFGSTPFSPAIKRILVNQGYTEPTHIQSQSWPIAIAQRDMISIARTGSGKTCAFLLPAFHLLNDTEDIGNKKDEHVNKQGRRVRATQPVSPSVLVLAPTRELAVQIQEEALKFGRASGIRSMVAHGGGMQLRNKQIKQLRTLRPNMMVCTPGRCNDFIEDGLIDLSNVKYLVLDEADRMLDMGFQPQIESIIESTPENRQTSLFSATWPREVRGLAADYLKDPVQLQVGNGELTANKAIVQSVKIVRNERDKNDALIELLTELDPERLEGRNADGLPKMIIFRARKHSCDGLVQMLKECGIRSDSLHGDKSQSARNAILDKFRKGHTKILVATDVASRGIDVKDVGAVINYDVPDQAEDYVHRIGRTGRGEAAGKSYTFVTPQELQGKSNFGKDLIGVLRRSEQEVPDDLENLVSSARHNDGRGRDRRWGNGKQDRGRGQSGSGGGNGRNYGGGDRGYDRNGGRGRTAPSRDRYGSNNNKGNQRYEDRGRGV